MKARLEVGALLGVVAVMGGCGGSAVSTSHSAITAPKNGVAARALTAPVVMPADAEPGGASYTTWSEGFWRWVTSIPAAQNPELVLDVDCGQGQSGPVFYIPGNQQNVYTRHCTVPQDAFLMIPVWGLLNDYPCPDPTFQPPPGETLEQFLAEGARAFDDAVTNLKVTLDGQPVDLSSYRFTTPLFNFTADLSLQTTLDACMTGTSQPGVSDGWWLILAPFGSGQHTVEITATSPFGNATDQTFVLTAG